MSDIRLKTITIEPLAAPLVIKNGSVVITDTTVSTSAMNGACVIMGGVGIGSTKEAVSATAGGALTISGGAGIMKNVYIGGDLSLSSVASNFRIEGVSVPRLNISDIFEVAPDGVNKRLSVTDTSFVLNMTANSTNDSSGALVVVGGASVGGNANATSVTAGGALTVGGGAAIRQDTFIGGSLRVTSGFTAGSSFIPNSNFTNVTTTSLRSTTIVGTSISVGALIASTGITSGTIRGASLFLTSGSLAATFNSNTMGNIFTTGGNVGIGLTNPSVMLAVNGTVSVDNGIRMLKSTGINYIQSGSSSTTSNSVADLRFTSMLGGTTFMTIASSGNVGIGTVSPMSLLDVAGTIDADIYTGGTLSVVSGTVGGLAVGDGVFSRVTAGNVVVSGLTTGTLLASATIISGGSFSATFNSNTVGSIFTTGGNVGINKTNPVETLDVNGSVVISGRTNLSNNSNTLGSIITTGGNVGLGTSNPVFRLDIRGTLGCDDVCRFSSTSSSVNSSTGGVVASGGVGVNGTEEATSVTSGGALTIAGGAAVRKRLFVGGGVVINESTVSSSSSVGAIVVSGGLGITSTSNSSSITNGGALTVGGGMGIGGDVYIGGQITGYTVASFNSISLDSTVEALSRSNGSLLTNGGVTIRCSTNAVSTTSGGALLVVGGGSVARDLIVGGNLVNTGGVVSTGTLRVSGSAFVDNGYWTSSGNDITLTANNNSINLRPSNSSLYSVSLGNTGVLTINGTVSSVSSSTGALVVSGGVGVVKGMNVGGDIKILSTTDSATVSSGALLVNGGVGIGGNLNVLGNTVLNGNLTVSGTTTSVISTNTTVQDNILVMNSGPSGTKDSGIIIERFQADNNTGSGDVVNDSLYATDILPSQSGMSSVQVKLSSGASGVDNFYVGYWIKVTSGFSNNQVRKITGYNGSTKVATVSLAWVSQNPAMGDTVFIYNKPFVGMIYNEILDRFEFGGCVGDPGQSNVVFTESLPVAFSVGTVITTQPAVNASTGGLVLSGGIAISNSTDAISSTNGGTITTLGGASIGKTLIVGSGLTVAGINMTPNAGDTYTSVTFNGSNNVAAPTDVSGLTFGGVWGFDVYLVARLVASENKYANFHLRGVNKGSTFELIKGYVGDDMGIDFSITSGGQVQYTSPNFPGFSSLMMKWRAFSN